MIKVYIAAIFLSQALMQPAQTWEWKDYGPSIHARRVNTIHIHYANTGAVVVTPDQWDTPKASIPYYWYWDNPLNQTAQQVIAIESMLAEELNEAAQSPLGQELQRLKDRIEEKVRRRVLTNP